MNHSKNLKSCPWCDAPTPSRADCLADHFAFYAPGQFQYWRGNMVMFGFWSGLCESIYLSFPFINALVNWRNRNARLVMDATRQEDAHD